MNFNKQFKFHIIAILVFFICNFPKGTIDPTNDEVVKSNQKYHYELEMKYAKQLIAEAEKFQISKSTFHYFGMNDQDYYSQFLQMKQRILSRNVSWKELYRFTFQLRTFADLSRNFVVLKSLRTKMIVIGAFTDLPSITTDRMNEIGNGDTLFKNDAEVLSAYMLLSYHMNISQDSTAFHNNISQSKLLKLVFYEPEIKLFSKKLFSILSELEPPEIEAMFECDLVYDRFTSLMLSVLRSEYLTALECKTKDSNAMSCFFQKYKKRDCIYVLGLMEKYNRCFSDSAYCNILKSIK